MKLLLNLMKWTLRILGGLLVLVILVVAVFLTVTQFHDGTFEGSMEINLAGGGPFTTGQWHREPMEPDWSFLKEYQTVEFQLLNPARSRRTYIMEHDGRIFVPSGNMNGAWEKIWKQWPKEAEKDGRAILRVDGKLYERQLVRIRDEEIATPVLKEAGRKYYGGAEIPFAWIRSGDVWLFELQPKSSSN